MKHLLFVYGSLMSGFHNNRYLRGQKKLGVGVTFKEDLTLFSLGSYPGAVRLNDQSEKDIKGEVWEVTPECLARLDQLEGHPTVYRRESVSVDYRSGDETIRTVAWCYIYLYSVNGRTEVGDSWKEFTE